MTIQIVEDDRALSDGIMLALKEPGLEFIQDVTVKAAAESFGDKCPKLIILDVNLPDGNRFSLCPEIKCKLPGLAVIFLTANDLEQDELNGFDLGADDYITKPFNIQILKRRVEVALRRGVSASAAAADSYDDGCLRLDFGSLTAVRSGEKLTITPNEYKLLRLLTANAGNIVTRRTLLERLWDCDGDFIDDHTLTVTMNRLRAKIEDPSHSYIRTVRGMGYIWTGEKL